MDYAGGRRIQSEMTDSNKILIVWSISVLTNSHRWEILISGSSSQTVPSHWWATRWMWDRGQQRLSSLTRTHERMNWTNHKWRHWMSKHIRQTHPTGPDANRQVALCTVGCFEAAWLPEPTKKSTIGSAGLGAGRHRLPGEADQVLIWAVRKILPWCCQLFRNCDWDPDTAACQYRSRDLLMCHDHYFNSVTVDLIFYIQQGRGCLISIWPNAVSR